MQLLISIFLNKLGVTPLIFACPTAFYGNLSAGFAKKCLHEGKNKHIHHVSIWQKSTNHRSDDYRLVLI